MLATLPVMQTAIFWYMSKLSRKHSGQFPFHGEMGVHYWLLLYKLFCIRRLVSPQWTHWTNSYQCHWISPATPHIFNRPSSSTDVGGNGKYIVTGQTPSELTRKSVIKHALFHMWWLFDFNSFVSGEETWTLTTTFATNTTFTRMFTHESQLNKLSWHT